jgi:hypothetical protein
MHVLKAKQRMDLVQVVLHAKLDIMPPSQVLLVVVCVLMVVLVLLVQQVVIPVKQVNMQKLVPRHACHVLWVNIPVQVLDHVPIVILDNMLLLQDLLHVPHVCLDPILELVQVFVLNVPAVCTNPVLERHPV